ncbi:hypothetical protein ACFLZ9_01375 [Patescibacteria group bacterium]
MKNLKILLVLIIIIFPLVTLAETEIPRPYSSKMTRSGSTATLTWKNPEFASFSKTILFRSTIPIEEYFTYEAVLPLCDKIYEGSSESYSDTGLAENLPYYYILFTEDKSGKHSGAEVVTIDLTPGGEESTDVEQVDSLAGVTSAVVNSVSLDEARNIYYYNNPSELELSEESKRLALFIIVKSPHDLTENDKNAISYFIHAGTPTTIFLGSGERTGVLNSYLSVFDKLPRSVLEWQDIIKIANGRWPNERSLESEEQAANVYFSTIYERKPNMDNPNDNAAVTVIAYGLRPGNRNLESERQAIEIYKSIFKKNPVNAIDWDLVRAIAYSGAIR